MIEGSEPKLVAGARREILPNGVREATEYRSGSKRDSRPIHDESSLVRGRTCRMSLSRYEPHLGQLGLHRGLGACRRSGRIFPAPGRAIEVRTTSGFCAAIAERASINLALRR
jgi:hypothetical protein